jgi:hypothetical protein
MTYMCRLIRDASIGEINGLVTDRKRSVDLRVVMKPSRSLQSAKSDDERCAKAVDGQDLQLPPFGVPMLHNWVIPTPRKCESV